MRGSCPARKGLLPRHEERERICIFDLLLTISKHTCKWSRLAIPYANAPPQRAGKKPNHPKNVDVKLPANYLLCQLTYTFPGVSPSASTLDPLQRRPDDPWHDNRLLPAGTEDGEWQMRKSESPNWHPTNIHVQAEFVMPKRTMTNTRIRKKTIDQRHFDFEIRHVRYRAIKIEFKLQKYNMNPIFFGGIKVVPGHAL